MKTIGAKLADAYKGLRSSGGRGQRVESACPPWRLRYGAPSGVRVYATGDIHGRADLLERRFAEIDLDLAARPVERAIEVYLGDYVDRGPASAYVIDLLIARRAGREIVTLLGNHEAIFQTFLASGERLDYWARLGGIETLASYGISAQTDAGVESSAEVAGRLRAVIPPAHLDFLAALQDCFVCGGCFFVHAGVRPGVPLARQSREDMIWIRDQFLASREDFGAIVIHGHTPGPEPEVLANRVNLDTLAYSSGRLTTAVIEGEVLDFLG